MFKHTLALVGLSLITLSANAALYDRGNGLIYDDVLNITWLQDANYAYTSGYAAANAVGSPHSGSTNIQAEGRMGWDAAKTWADQLSYGGYDDWRLASANLMNPTSPCYARDGSCDRGFNTTTGELGHMFYNNLGNLGRYDTNGNHQSGYGVTNSSFTDGNSGASVSIVNLKNSVYWLGEDYAPTDHAWAFNTGNGNQNYYTEYGSRSSWAVRAGDVSSVPVPAAAWLFGSALLGLAGVKRRHR